MLKKGLLTLISIPYSLWLWFWVFAVFTAHFIIISLTAWTKKDPQLYAHKWAQKYLAFGMLMSGTPIDVKGVENIPQGAFVLTSNHQSLFDTALHVIKCPELLLFTPKLELTKIPILGWDIKMQGHVSIDRSNSKSASQSLKKIDEKLNEGRAFIFFPEGTRSTSDTMGPFKMGAFKVAHQAGVPIIPAYIHNAHKFMNKKRRLIATPTKVSVTYGKPIPSNLPPAELKEKIREAMINLQKEYLS